MLRFLLLNSDTVGGTLEGVPPLTYKVKKAGFLTNYRIYGQTVNGESVGDLVTSGEHEGEYNVPVTVEGVNLFDYDTITHGYRIKWSTGENYADETAIMSDFISVSENSTYATDTKLYWVCYDTNKQYIGAWNGSDIVKSGVDAINSMTAISPCKFIRILSFSRKVTPINSATMLNCGSTALPYEPYHAPITTPIYLPEPIKMVGGEAEYIEYGTQKMYRIGADDLDVTLPALPTVTGTNVLSVGTEIQPSMVEVMGRIKAVPTN